MNQYDLTPDDDGLTSGYENHELTELEGDVPSVGPEVGEGVEGSENPTPAVWGSAYLTGAAVPPTPPPVPRELSIYQQPQLHHPVTFQHQRVGRGGLRKAFKLASILCCLVALGFGVFLVIKALEKPDGAYLAALESDGFGDVFASPKAAIGHAKGLCEKFDSGETVEGFASEKIAVEHYCDEYLAAFVVIPTEQERAEAYYADLDSEQLTPTFASQSEAVQAAKKFCNGLESGEPAAGMKVDKIAVKHYCDSYSDGFKVLEQRTVTGTFTIWDFSFSRYYQSISSFGSSCTGDGGYSDIGSSTAVIVTSGTGEVLARTTLGSGSGSSARCKFTFSFDVIEGEDTYIVSVGRRGDSQYTWSELIQDDAIQLSMGL